MLKRRALAFAVVLLAVAIGTFAFAHSGGRDSQGGHNDRKHGGYHFHAGPLSGQSFASKSEASAALNAHEQRTAPVPTRTTLPATSSAPRSCDCDALAHLLIAKGIITAEELAAATNQGQ